MASPGPEPIDVHWTDDVARAEWLTRRLESWTGTVASVVPRGFDAYARLFHPVQHNDDSRSWLTWREIAAANGRVVHPEMQLHAIATPVGEEVTELALHEWSPGSLRDIDLAALIGVLAAHTSTADRCSFCIWNGYGWDSAVSLSLKRRWLGRLRARRRSPPVPNPIPHEVFVGPKVAMRDLEYLLYEGAIAKATAFVGHHVRPNLWWPDDRAWVVASDIDLCWTYIAGSHALVDELVADDRFEVIPAQLHDRITIDGDAINR
jgi:hypothetical protein